MASITKRPDGRWRARYRDDTGKEHARHFPTKAKGQQWLDGITASVVRGDYVDPRAGKTTVRVFGNRWESIQVSSDATRRIVDNALRLHILPRIGAMQLGGVRRSDVQALVKELESKGLAPANVRNIYEVCSRLFASAVDDRLIASTPCQRITLPRGGGEEVVPPTVEEVMEVRDTLDERWRAVVVTLAGSGVRIGELLGLRVSDVDFLRRTIRVERQRTQGNRITPTKGRRSRTVPVGQVVIDELAAHLATYPAADTALFTDEWGRPLTYTRWKKLLQVATAEAGVDVTSHGFRHFFASALIAGGASVKQVQTVLGHSSAVITLRTYAHLFPGEEDRTRDVMDAALSPLADSLRTEATSEG